MVLGRECDVIGVPAIDLDMLPGLTAREEEVAVLAGRGLSNLDIAERLVLSVRTVEAHLSHVYAKFGITRRADLAAALGLRVDRPAAVPVPRSELLPESGDPFRRV
jgi:DNA-binding CsgD family transcriptional regulator